MAELKEGDKAPEFSLADAGGRKVKLSDFAGRKVVLYFYPKDDTPGCTTEACEFRDLQGSFAGKNAAVVGISPDSPESHAKFAGKFSLPFTLLCDPSHETAEKYGAWGEKSLYGKTSMGILRTTVIIDEGGRVERIFRKVKAAGHAAEVLSAV
ncbi:MAG: Alkyl hydroperoxide reductase [Deltaproteobacteria bacterium]|nr:Alkyl hydroperoxide reductase [Deltaproteobacteria bacterium]